MVINQSREHVMSGAVNDLPDISRVDPPVLRRLRNAAVDNENVGYAVYVPGRVHHMAAPEPEIVLSHRFRNLHNSASEIKSIQKIKTAIYWQGSPPEW